MTIPEAEKRNLYAYINILLKERGCYLLRINGAPNHIHMLINLHPSLALSALMRDIKSKTSAALAKDARFPHFQKWAKEYFAASISESDKDTVIRYIRSQEEHHGTISFDDELKQLCLKYSIELHPGDFVE